MDYLGLVINDVRVIDSDHGHYRTCVLLEKGTIRSAIGWSIVQLGRPAPSWGGVAPLHSVAAPPEAIVPAQRKRKTFALIDQAAEMDVTLMPDQEVRRMSDYYHTTFGTRPQPHEEPSGEQLSALKVLLDDVVLRNQGKLLRFHTKMMAAKHIHDPSTNQSSGSFGRIRRAHS
eukprot:3429813-Amphidinium_carterae.2